MRSSTWKVISLACVALFVSGPAWSQVYVEVDKFVSNDHSDTNFFGSVNDVSGTVAIVGAPGDDTNGTNSGTAYMFTFDGTDWIQQAKLFPDDPAIRDTFGIDVATIVEFSGFQALLQYFLEAAHLFQIIFDVVHGRTRHVELGVFVCDQVQARVFFYPDLVAEIVVAMPMGVD